MSRLVSLVLHSIQLLYFLILQQQQAAIVVGQYVFEIFTIPKLEQPRVAFKYG